MIKNENTYVVHGWMINDYKLSGNELLTYAIIFGFSQEENNTFVCSLDYLASWLCCSKKTAEKALFGLKSKGLIEQVVVGNNKYKKSEYVALRPLNSTVVDSTIVKNTTVTMEEITTANTNNINNNKEKKKKEIEQDTNNVNIIIDKFNFSDNVVSSIQDWLKHKKEKQRKPYTPTGLNKILKQIQDNINVNGEKHTVECINECIERNYAGLFFTIKKPVNKNKQITLDDVKEIRTTNEIFE